MIMMTSLQVLRNCGDHWVHFFTFTVTLIMVVLSSFYLHHDLLNRDSVNVTSRVIVIFSLPLVNE